METYYEIKLYDSIANMVQMFESEDSKHMVKHDCKKDEDKDEVVDELEKLLIATLESLELKLHKEEHQTSRQIIQFKEDSMKKCDELRKLEEQEMIRREQIKILSGIIPSLKSVKCMVREEEIHRVIHIWEQREREIYRFEDLIEKGAEPLSKIDVLKRILLLGNNLAVLCELRENELRKKIITTIEEIHQKMMKDIVEQVEEM